MIRTDALLPGKHSTEGGFATAVLGPWFICSATRFFYLDPAGSFQMEEISY
jgi:hypothetical protein